MKEDLKQTARKVGERGVELLGDALFSTASYLVKTGRIIGTSIGQGIETVKRADQHGEFNDAKNWEKPLLKTAAFLGGAYFKGKDEFNSLKSPDRSLILKGTGITSLLAIAGIWHVTHRGSDPANIGSQPGVYSDTPDGGVGNSEFAFYEDRPKQIVDSLSQFKGIKQALFLCSNKEQYRLVVGAFQQRDATSSNDINISRVEQGKICVGGFTCEMPDGGSESVSLIIINAEEVTDTEINKIIDEKNLNDQFSFIALRGHTGDMPSLFERASAYKDEKCFFQLGGCIASDYIPTYGNNSTPIAGSNSTAYATRNNNWALLSIEAMNSQFTSSWRDVQDYINSRSQTAESELVLPQDAGI